MGRAMTESEVRDFMVSGTRTGKLATVRSDGSPHVMPVWFTFDPETGDLVFMTWHTSLKARNMQRDGRVSISVDDQRFFKGNDPAVPVVDSGRGYGAPDRSYHAVGDLVA